MRHAPLLALAAILPLSACAVVPNAGPIVDSPHEIAQQGSLVPLLQPVQVGSVVATPMRVTEDSRCPMNARCVWAGKLTVSTRIAATHWAQTAPLTLGEPYEGMGRPYVLVSATPGQTTDREIPAGEYRFTFERR